MKVVIEPTQGWSGAAAYVAQHMRAADVREVRALNASTPEEALRRALGVSEEAYVATVGGTPIAMLGSHTQAIGLIGVPWLLGTAAVSRVPAQFVRLSRKFMSHLQARHSRLQNVVHAENTASIAYLRAIGFELTPRYKTATGADAHTFYMEGHVDV